MTNRVFCIPENVFNEMIKNIFGRESETSFVLTIGMQGVKVGKIFLFF